VYGVLGLPKGFLGVSEWVVGGTPVQVAYFT
jgi:hypothetical protein